MAESHVSTNKKDSIADIKSSYRKASGELDCLLPSDYTRMRNVSTASSSISATSSFSTDSTSLSTLVSSDYFLSNLKNGDLLLDAYKVEPISSSSSESSSVVDLKQHESSLMFNRELVIDHSNGISFS